MAEVPVQPVSVSRRASSKSAGEIVFSSATEALGSALVVCFLGVIAIQIAASFAGGMIPSWPPGTTGASPAVGHPRLHAIGRGVFHGGEFGFFFAVFFAHSLWMGFHGRDEGDGVRRLRRILWKLREDWFGLIIGNAVKAWVTALVLSIVGEWSFTQMVWHWLWGAVQASIEKATGLNPHSWDGTGVGRWFSWYRDNQSKLNFWLLYLGGVCDDLGAPNFKTLARWSWRRFQKRNDTVSTASVRPADLPAPPAA